MGMIIPLMEQLMDYLNDMALFVEVVKTRSFRRAADVLGMPNSTLSRRIALLEKGVGLRLINRTTRRLELTEAGQLYYERCKRIVEEARIAYEELGGMVERPTGTLKVSMPADFATTYVAPLLPDFATLYPGIALDLDLTPRNVDLVGEPFDLAIRMRTLESSTLISRVIGRLSAKFYASPGYLANRGEPPHPNDLESHECLTMSVMTTWEARNGHEVVNVKADGRFRMNSVAMIRKMAALGMGIAFLPDRIATEGLVDGTLLNILKDWAGPELPIYAVTETRLLPAKTQRFIDFLKANLRDLG